MGLQQKFPSSFRPFSLQSSFSKDGTELPPQASISFIPQEFHGGKCENRDLRLRGAQVEGELKPANWRRKNSKIHFILMVFSGNELQMGWITRKIGLTGIQHLFYFTVLSIGSCVSCPQNSHGPDSCFHIPDPSAADLFTWLCG